MTNTRISIPRGQTWLIKRMQSLGYLANKRGVCFGVAYMAMCAVLNRDIDGFDQALANIYSIPEDLFPSTINNLNKEYIDRLENAKKNLWKTLFPTVQESNFNALTLEQKTQFENEWHAKLDELRSQRPELLHIYNFFEGIEVAQNVKHYSPLFNKKHTPRYQHPGLISRRIYPQNLKHKINYIASISGMFSTQDLTDYFNELMFICKQTPEVTDPIAIMIYGKIERTGDEHEICVGYDPFQGWYFIDANALPTYKISNLNTDEIAKKVIETFSKNNNAILTNKIISVKPNLANINAISREEKIKQFQQEEKKKMVANVSEKVKLVDSSNSSWLMKAIEKNNLKLVKTLLDAGADPNLENQRGVTPFLLAIKFGYTYMTKLLLENKANIHFETANGDTPLLMAAENGKIEIIKILVNNIDLEEANKDGVTAFHAAARKGQKEIVNFLLDIGQDLEVETSQGFTPLMLAAQYGQLDIVQQLLTSNADINHQAKDCSTALFIAAKEGHFEVVKLLLSQKANPNLTVAWNEEQLENFTDLDIITALEKMIKQKYPDFEVNTEIDEDQKVNARTFEFSPLEIAEIMVHKEIVSLLQETILAQNPPDDANNQGYSLLIVAAKQGDIELVKELLEQQSDINYQSIDGSTALFFAAREGHLDVVKLLLENGADPSLSAIWDEEYIEEFAHLRNVEDAMSEVISNNFGINDDEGDDMTVDTYKISPLEIAEIMGYKEIAQLLEVKLLQQLEESILAKSESLMFFSQPKNDREISQSSKTSSPINEETNYKKTG